MSYGFIFGVTGFLISIGTIIYAYAKFNTLMTNDMKHIGYEIKDIKSTIEKKSILLDNIENRLVKMEAQCELRHKNNGR